LLLARWCCQSSISCCCGLFAVCTTIWMARLLSWENVQAGPSSGLSKIGYNLIAGLLVQPVPLTTSISLFDPYRPYYSSRNTAGWFTRTSCSSVSLSWEDSTHNEVLHNLNSGHSKVGSIACLGRMISHAVQRKNNVMIILWL
jgi:hypothetical protein